MSPKQLATAGVRLLAVYFGLGGLHTGLSALTFGAHAERLPPFIVASTLRAAVISIAIGVVLWLVATKLSHLLLPDPVDGTTSIDRRDLLPSRPRPAGCLLRLQSRMARPGDGGRGSVKPGRGEESFLLNLGGRRPVGAGLEPDSE